MCWQSFFAQTWLMQARQSSGLGLVVHYSWRSTLDAHNWWGFCTESLRQSSFFARLDYVPTVLESHWKLSESGHLGFDGNKYVFAEKMHPSEMYRWLVESRPRLVWDFPREILFSGMDFRIWYSNRQYFDRQYKQQRQYQYHINSNQLYQ